MVFGKKKKAERVDVEAEVVTRSDKKVEKEPEIQIVVFDELILAELRAIRTGIDKLVEISKEE